MNTNDRKAKQIDNSSQANDDDPKKKKAHLRKAAGIVWKDPSLDDWPENDFRIFCGNLGNEVTTDILANAFRKYKSFNMAKVIREKRNNKTKGYGFVSLSDPQDMLDALKNMNNKFIGNRPITVKRSRWKDRELDSKKNKDFDNFIKDVYSPTKKFRKFKKPVKIDNKEVHDRLIDKKAKNS
ncbi:RNA-binding protein [Plasmodium ovale wallikeri]|uniref:RNA-binding protein n=2 Tax=Plasmodium ovale TaxID=36330 RepID=A0A1A8Z1Q6_PLAOA|nr:RNA-binding protein [Plasmodium ovale wallikeri]SBT37838.1 RNA-binding protein [Plasmodium ovale wallikeri]SBT77555.1 RNA-binding protein, putative [Plasmodium ovale]